jgi:photosystem II stability/assembly factor-like uncharacterized protein
MKKRFILLALLLIGFINISMAQWEVKYLGDLNYHNVVKFKNDSLGLVMGDDSFAVKTTDAGESWTLKDLNVLMNVFDFQFVDDSVVYAVGDHYIGAGSNLTSKLIVSSDNGETWDSIANFPGKQLFSLNFFDIESGLIAGNDGVFRTTDSGNTWDTVVTMDQLGYKFGEIKQMSFPSPQTGYAIGSGYLESMFILEDFLLKTTDAGLTWDVVNILDHEPTALYFLDETTGFVGTYDGLYGFISKTTDGGLTWDEKHNNEYIPVTDIHFISDNTGFVTGGYEISMPGPTAFGISKTTDGGENWYGFDTIGLPLKSIYFLNDTTGFVAGWHQLVMKLSGGSISELPDDYPWHLVDTGMSVNEEHLNDNFKIYPNPTRGILHLEALDLSTEIQRIEIISITGQVKKVLDKPQGIHKATLDISGFTSGVYFIRILTSGHTGFLKVIKQ